MQKIFLDARELEHPLPLQLSLNHLQKMDSNQYLYMLHRKKPIPLLEIAKEKDFSYLLYEEDTNLYHILISKNKNSNLKELLDV